MFFTKRLSQEDKELERARVRARKVPTGDLLLWADQAVFGIGRHLSEYSRHGGEEDLEEARIAATALKAVLDDLSARADTPTRILR